MNAPDPKARMTGSHPGTARPVRPSTAAPRQRQPAEAAPPETDEDLVDRVRRGDPRAADQLIRRYQNRVHRIVFPLCGFDAEEARDVVQEVFLQVFRSLPAFEGRSRFSTWLYRIAVNAAHDARRRRRRWRDVFFGGRRGGESDEAEERDDPLASAVAPEEETDPVFRIAAGELERAVRRAVGKLSRHQQTVFTLKVLQEMSLSEIAELTGMAEGTIKSHLFRATRSLRGQLGSLLDRCAPRGGGSS
ncbi:MAG: sigma-70 family RNA polymerase sigma factor [Desulfobacterales bacterium]